MASSNAQVSYVGVYKGWMKTNRELDRDSTIPIEVLLAGLRFSDVVSKFERQLVDAEKTDEEKLLKLFTVIMPGKGEQGFNRVVNILTENKYNELANDLIGGLNRECSTNSSLHVQNPRILQAQAHLSRLIKDNVDLMAKYWSDVIRVAQTEAAFVQVQVLEHFKAQNGASVGSYREVFHKDEKTIHKRILIQADPGCGKTTYVNKLALDWANEDEYLRDKFDFVFLIALQTLTMDVFDEIKWFLPDESEQFFESYAKSSDSKILLILDGFDELVETSEWYSSVMNTLNGQSKQFQLFHLIVTTRRSHVQKIPQQFHGRSLLIEGFNVQSMKQFLIMQRVPFPSVGQQSNLSRHLLQTPLFCAIYCSLHFGGGDPIQLEDSYDLIKSLIENSVTNTIKKKTVANEEEQLDEIGKFAFQMLDSKTLDFQKKFCRSSEVIKPSFDLSTVNLDLLIKRTIPLHGVNRSKEEFSLPHQLIAEYLGARYFARSLTEEQLKQADASALIPTVFSRVLDFPFVRFFLFELLFLYLEKKYEENVFNDFLNIPQLRFFWNIKSNTDIPTLDNIRDIGFNNKWNSEFTNHSRFIPTLSKCPNLSSLSFSGFSKNLVKQLIQLINNNCFQKLIKLDLGWNENVGSTPQLFTTLSKCKHLKTLNIQRCKLTVESTTELGRCIDNNGLANLTQLALSDNENVESTPQLITALSKCKHLKTLNIQRCKLTVESTTELGRCIDNHGLANLTQLYLSDNEKVGSTPQLFTALCKCKHLQLLNLQLCKMTVESTTELGRCIDNNGLANLTQLYLSENEKVGSIPQLFTALCKSKHLKTINIQRCKLTVESTTELGRCIDNNGLANLTQLYLSDNENVGSTPQLFTALRKCKHLKTLKIQRCKLTVESTTELARCIDNNGLAYLTQLHLSNNTNIGSSTDLFHVLHQSPQLQMLDLEDCSITQESLNILLSTFNSNTFQQLDYISLWRNEEIKVDYNFFIALEKCPKISRVHISKSMKSDLSKVGRKAKETLEQRGCQFRFK